MAQSSQEDAQEKDIKDVTLSRGEECSKASAWNWQGCQRSPVLAFKISMMFFLISSLGKSSDNKQEQV